MIGEGDIIANVNERTVYIMNISKLATLDISKNTILKETR